MSAKVKIQKQIEKAHAEFSASGSHRWLACAASTELCKLAPPSRESPWAKEGTTAHTVLERLVKQLIASGRDPKKIRATLTMLRQRFPEAMVDHCLTALEYIQSRWQEIPGSELFCEVKAALPVSEPGQFGTADIVIAEHFGRLIIMDFKYGAGVPVEVVDPDTGEPNSQLIYYALGVAHQFDYNFTSVELCIIQPRAAIGGKTIRAWVTDIDTLLEWRERFEKGIQAARGENPPYKSGDHCRWCPAKVICPELKDRAFKQAQLDFPDDDTLNLPAVPGKGQLVVKQMSSRCAIGGFRKPAPMANLATILPALDKLETWIAAVRDHAFNVLESGGKIPGFILTEKRATRKWNEPAKAMRAAHKLFGDAALTQPELLSPAELEKLGTRARDFVRENATAVSSGLKLAADPVANEFPDDID